MLFLFCETLKIIFSSFPKLGMFLFVLIYHLKTKVIIYGN